MEKDIKDFFRCIISNKPFAKQFSIGDAIKVVFSDSSSSDDIKITNLCDSLDDIKKRNAIRMFCSLLSYKDIDYSKITIDTFINSEDLNATIDESLKNISSSEFEILSKKYSTFINLLDTLLEEATKEDF